ncbi:tetratricopeptide repeat protein [Rhizophagus clarus]|uniref:Tetratricopeptide repeat protein n=1 Tax=Rhizophagus clarus TaxID=94130 RepID=A0A8H3M1Z7_9GLOM|nr:tetratricopeptide repeat protein [Rhizophagus clarus]
MENYKESKFWFTSLIGFFYQVGIGCNLNKEMALDFYLITINNNKIENDHSLNVNFNQLHLIENNDDSFNLLRNYNIIIGKYLLSLFYYKDNILDVKENKLTNLLKLTENNNLEKQYNSIICCQNRNMKANYRKIFQLLLRLTEKGNLDAQYNLAICYMDGIGIQEDGKKALELFLKSDLIDCLDVQNKNEIETSLKYAILNNSIAQNNLGHFYQHGEGVCKNEMKAFKWYLKSAENGQPLGQNNLGDCYKYGNGTIKDETKAFEWNG